MKWLRKVWIGLLSGIALCSSCTTGEPSCVYGPPMEDAGDSLQMSAKEQRRRELQQRLETLRATIEEREGSEVYGPPEMIERYGRKTEQLRHEADSISRELEELEN